MSRFELIDATSAAGALFFVSDMVTGASYVAPDDFERASHALMALNALKPTWFACTFKGKVYVDVRAMVGGSLYAMAGSFAPDEVARRNGVTIERALCAVIRSIEFDLHKYVALHG